MVEKQHAHEYFMQISYAWLAKRVFSAFETLMMIIRFLRGYETSIQRNWRIENFVRFWIFVHETTAETRDRCETSVSILFVLVFLSDRHESLDKAEVGHGQLGTLNKFENDAWHPLQNTKIYETSVRLAIQHTLNKSSKTVRFEMRVNRMAHYLLWAQLITTTFSEQKPKNDRKLRGENYTHQFRSNYLWHGDGIGDAADPAHLIESC